MASSAASVPVGVDAVEPPRLASPNVMPAHTRAKVAVVGGGVASR